MTSTSVSRLDGLNASAAIKVPCKVATTANITLSGEQTIDSIAVTDGDRVLVKDQTDATENGIYSVSTGTWQRTQDFDGNRDITSGTQVYVFDGATQTAGIWRLTTDNPITIGTSELDFEKDAGASGPFAISDVTGLQAALDAKLGIAGGTMTGQINFSGTDHAGIKLISLTTTQRNNLTADVGMVIYNTTTGHLEGYDSSATWRDLGAGAGSGLGTYAVEDVDALSVSTDISFTTTQDFIVAATGDISLDCTGASASLTANEVFWDIGGLGLTANSVGAITINSQDAVELTGGAGSIVIGADGTATITADDVISMTAASSFIIEGDTLLLIGDSGVSLDGAGEIDVNDNNLTNVADPSNAQDAATKAYVDANTTGAQFKSPVVAATTTTLPACTYNNGASGVGATLTGNSNGAFAAVDGVTLTINQRILVKNQASGLQNGLYQLSTVGDGSNPYVLTRVTDADVNTEIAFATVLVSGGSTNGGTTWNLPLASGSITMGTTGLTFVQTGLGAATSFADLSEVTTITPDALLPPNNPSNSLSQAVYDLGVAETIAFRHSSIAAQTRSRTVQILRTANSTTGTASFVNSGLFVYDSVTAAGTSHEWAIAGVMRNTGGSTGENVGVYGQGWGYIAGHKTWGAVAEARDFSGGATSCWGLEVDCFANSNFTNNNLVCAYFIGGKADSGGATPLIYSGIIVEAQNNSNTSANFRNGIMVGDFNQRSGTPLACTNAINTYITGTNVIWDRSTATNGAAMTGTYSGGAFAMNQGSYIVYNNDSGANVKSRYDGVYIEHTGPIEIAAAGASGQAIIQAAASSGFQYGIDFNGVNFASGFVLRSTSFNLENSGTLDFVKQTLAGSAGSSAGYITIKVGGIQKKVQCLNL